MARIINTTRVLHSQNRSIIDAVEFLPDFTPENGGTYYGVSIKFRNGDIVRFYDLSLIKVRSFAVGSVYNYQLEDIIDNYDDGTNKTKTKFVYHFLHTPFSVQAAHNRVDELQWYIKRAAELSANSFNTELDVFEETAFKDRANTIFYWMKDMLLSEDFGEDPSVKFDINK